MSYVTGLTNVLDEHLRWHRVGWHRARLRFMARFILSALQLTTSNLRRIAVSPFPSPGRSSLIRYAFIGAVPGMLNT
jgi:hypothetical protein